MCDSDYHLTTYDAYIYL